MCSGLENSVKALFRALPRFIGVGLICVHIWNIFAISSVHLFRGTFHHCADAKTDEALDTVSNRTVCESLGNKSAVWKNTDLNFDNVGNALTALVH